jgi:hypothetical protein
MKRLGIVAMFAGAVLCLWLGMHVATVNGQAQAVIDVGRVPPARFVIKTTQGDKGWLVYKMDTQIGQTWRLDKDVWIPISEATTAPTSLNANYDLMVLRGEKPDSAYCIRIDTSLGTTWILDKDHWVLTK